MAKEPRNKRRIWERRAIYPATDYSVQIGKAHGNTFVVVPTMGRMHVLFTEDSTLTPEMRKDIEEFLLDRHYVPSMERGAMHQIVPTPREKKQ